MNKRQRGPLALIVAVSLCGVSLVSPTAGSAQGDCTDRSVCGEVSPLIPMQSTEAVHMGLVWKQGSQAPSCSSTHASPSTHLMTSPTRPWSTPRSPRAL